MIKKKTFLSGDLFMLYNVVLWKISFPGWYFPASYGLYQNKISCRQPWWRSLVNTSLISQFLENDNGFSFLANAPKGKLFKISFSTNHIFKQFKAILN